MKRVLLTLGAMALASAAYAQTSPPPSPNMANQPTARSMSGPPANEAQAKELILRDGYTEVGELKKGNDGMWRGTAKRGDRSMQVTVDKDGKVSP
jgi:hypothetical protein